MYTIVTDNQITRNRKVHHVISPMDLVVFSDPMLSKCIEFLRENDTHSFFVDFGEYRAMLYFQDDAGEHRGPIMGWLHRSPEAEADGGADAQAATVVGK